jgi:hypothetical protein
MNIAQKNNYNKIVNYLQKQGAINIDIKHFCDSDYRLFFTIKNINREIPIAMNLCTIDKFIIFCKGRYNDLAEWN